MRMREAGRILAECHQGIARLIGPGITTLEIDRFVESFLAERGATPEQKDTAVFRLRPALPSTTSFATGSRTTASCRRGIS